LFNPKFSTPYYITEHGTELGLEPVRDLDGNLMIQTVTNKPIAKGNIASHEQFAANLKDFMKNFEM
jgi:hypothetical protein